MLFSMLKDYNWLPDFVYGSIDGIITTFAIVSAVQGGGLDSKIILILGFANMLADGFSMATSKYLSDNAEIDQAFNKGEPIDQGLNPIKGAVSTFIAFVTLGAIPLLAYVFQPFLKYTEMQTFVLACALTSFALFFVGFMKGFFVDKSKLYEGFITMFLGGIAAGISYYVGFVIERSLV